MLVWQVVDGYFHSVDLHDHVGVLRVQVNITTSAEMKMLFSFVSWWMKTTISFSCSKWTLTCQQSSH